MSSYFILLALADFSCSLWNGTKKTSRLPITSGAIPSTGTGNWKEQHIELIGKKEYQQQWYETGSEWSVSFGRWQVQLTYIHACVITSRFSKKQRIGQC
jgi:hypothetical protein